MICFYWFLAEMTMCSIAPLPIPPSQSYRRSLIDSVDWTKDAVLVHVLH